MTQTPHFRRAQCYWLPSGDAHDPHGSVTFGDQGYVSIADSISYHVRFHNGELNHALNRKGELLELWGKDVSFSRTPEGSFLFLAETKPR